MIDVSKTIAPKSDQLNADDLIAGSMTVKITRVSKSDASDQPIPIYFEGDNNKPYKPCKSMRRVLVHCWGKDGQGYVGKSMTLYRDEKVTWGGAEVGGIRISHMSHLKDKVTMALTATKSSRKPFVVLPLAVASEPQPSAITPEIRQAAENAAAGGVDAYTAWLDKLDPKVKETVRSIHSEMSRKAKAADAAKQQAETEVPFGDDDTPAM